MSNGLQYEEVSAIEAFGHIGIGVKILIASTKPISKEVSDKINYDLDLCHKIEALVRADINKHDPEHQASIVEEKAALVALFPQPIYVKPIENGYGERMDFPWFNVTTSKGVIKIGWRRRVINIDWSESDIKAKAEDLFPEEKVTKGDHHIHAWDYAKAKAYIDILLAAQ